MKIALSLAALLSLFDVVSSFSTGAGRCVVGEAAPQHPAPAEGEGGELASGNYEITVNGEAYTSGSTVSVDAGTPFDIVVSGPDFRGFLIMLAGQPDTALEGSGDGTKQADGAGCENTASVTHTDSGFKTEVTATGVIAEAVSTTIEVNVVVQNSGGVSLFYYTQVPLEVVAGDAVPPPPDATDAPAETPVDTTDAPTGSPVAPVPGGEVCAEGLVMDNFCIDRGTLLDPSGVVTLLEPEKHTYHCLFDVDLCVDSGYTILKEPAEGETMYTVAYAFDPESNTKVLELGQASGVCDTCALSDGPTNAFRIGMKGMIVDSSVDPPLVSITELEATDGTTDYCNWGSTSPNGTPEEPDVPDETDEPAGTSGSISTGPDGTPEETDEPAETDEPTGTSGSLSIHAGVSFLISALFAVFRM